MTFKEAYIKMLEGKKIARPCFKGYWYIDGYTGTAVIHTRDDKELTKSDNLSLTLINVMAEDWEVYNSKTVVVDGSYSTIYAGKQSLQHGDESNE